MTFLADMNWKRNGSDLLLAVPDYQREFVWSEDRYKNYIRSIFDGELPLSPIFIDARDNSTWYIIDGKHRINALILFYNDNLEVDGVYYSDLDRVDQMFFEMQILPTYDVKYLSQADIIRLYLKLNFEAVPHTGQDREKAERLLKSVNNDK